MKTSEKKRGMHAGRNWCMHAFFEYFFRLQILYSVDAPSMIAIHMLLRLIKYSLKSSNNIIVNQIVARALW